MLYLCLVIHHVIVHASTYLMLKYEHVNVKVGKAHKAKFVRRLELLMSDIDDAKEIEPLLHAQVHKIYSHQFEVSYGSTIYRITRFLDGERESFFCLNIQQLLCLPYPPREIF